VESGPAQEILANPQHPYTQRLVAAAPSLASRRIQSSVAAHKPVEHTSSDSVAVVDLVAAAETRAEARAQVDSSDIAIKFENVRKLYKIRQGNFGSSEFAAVDGVNFEVARGTTMALVGESGSGKSTVAKLLLQLEDKSDGKIFIDGAETGSLSRKQLFDLRRKMQPVFQDPYGSLDPLRNIGNTIAEPLITHSIGTRASRKQRVLEILDQVALPKSVFTRYPNELSGGQRQRVAIARALALKPEIVVLDEAVSALDVLVQAQILNLLADLQSELGLTYLFITHDLAVVRVIADNVCVMQKGKIVEASSVDDVFDNPKMEYTRELLAAIPGARAAS
jgi:peptide/nickel transport system ATP-binding protein